MSATPGKLTEQQSMKKEWICFASKASKLAINAFAMHDVPEKKQDDCNK